jgi:hypothetical protein
LLPAGSVVHTGQTLLRPPPPPSRLDATSRSAVIRTDCSWNATQGQGGLLQFRPSPSTRSTPHTAGGPSTLHLQDLHVFPGLHRDTPGSAPPGSPHGVGLTPRQASRHAADRVVAPPTLRAFDTGLQHRAFPPDTASLLPGSLTTTGTGLSPAGDNQLPNTTIRPSDPPPSNPIAGALWTRSNSSNRVRSG